MSKTLIISPHMDDEVHACASFLLDNEEAHIYYMTDRHATIQTHIMQEENINLLKKLTSVTAEVSINKCSVNQLDMLPKQTLVDEYQKLYDRHTPEVLAIPNASYNQDHRAVYESALTAVRPHDQHHFIKKVLVLNSQRILELLEMNKNFDQGIYDM